MPVEPMPDLSDANTEIFTIDFLRGEALDYPGAAKGHREVRLFTGMDLSAQGAERNMLITADGSEMLNNLPLQRAHIQGAAGVWNGSTWSGSENTAAGTYNQDLHSDPGSMSMLMLTLAEIKGDVFCDFHNGNGYNLFGTGAGMQGFCCAVYQETWDEDEPAGAGAGVQSQGAFGTYPPS